MGLVSILSFINAGSTGSQQREGRYVQYVNKRWGPKKKLLGPSNPRPNYIGVFVKFLMKTSSELATLFFGWQKLPIGSRYRHTCWRPCVMINRQWEMLLPTPVLWQNLPQNLTSWFLSLVMPSSSVDSTDKPRPSADWCLCGILDIILSVQMVVEMQSSVSVVPVVLYLPLLLVQVAAQFVLTRRCNFR